jgi:hypothetical protein
MEHTEHICTILDNLHKRLSHLESLSVNYMEDTRENRKYFHYIDLEDPLKRFVALNHGNDEAYWWKITYFDGDSATVVGNKKWSEHDRIYKTAQINLTVRRYPDDNSKLLIHGSYKNKQGQNIGVDMSIEHELASEFITNMIIDSVYKVEGI